MAGADRGLLIKQIDRLWSEGSLTGLHESQLLDRYLSRRDERAFEALVDRHGPMVLGLCRRMLRDPRDIEDAFQATFLILVRKASTIRDGERLSCWLYGVAFRVATRARQTTMRRRKRESTLDSTNADLSQSPLATSTTIDHLDLAPILDQELARLPEKYRQPLILCYLDGNSHEQAAERLHWPVGTVRSRMARGRALLKTRLTRRGFAPMAIWLGNGLTTSLPVLTETVPLPLVTATVRAAIQLGPTKLLPSAVAAASVLSLTRGVLTTMQFAQLKWPSIGLMATTVLGGGAIAVGYASGPRAKPGPNSVVVAVERPAPADPQAPAAPSPVSKDNAAPKQSPKPPEKNLTAMSDEELASLLEETLNRVAKAARGRASWSPEALELGRRAASIAEALESEVEQVRENFNDLTKRVDRAEAAVAKAEERKEAANLAHERMRALSSQRASLASPDDVLKAEIDAKLAVNQYQRKQDELERWSIERSKRKIELTQATNHLDRVRDRVYVVRAKIGWSRATADPSPLADPPAPGRDQTSATTPLVQPQPAPSASPLLKDPATSVAITPNPFELFSAQASRPPANISNLSIQMLILPLRQKLDELEKADPAATGRHDLPTQQMREQLLREIRQHHALLQALAEDLNDDLTELTQEQATINCQLGLANAKMRAVATTVERNKRINDRKPGMVSPEDVAKADAELEVESAQLAIIQSKEKGLASHRRQIDSKRHNIMAILERAVIALNRMDPTPQKNAKP